MELEPFFLLAKLAVLIGMLVIAVTMLRDFGGRS